MAASAILWLLPVTALLSIAEATICALNDDRNAVYLLMEESQLPGKRSLIDSSLAINDIS